MKCILPKRATVTRRPSLVQYAVQSTSHRMGLPYDAVGTRVTQAIHNCGNSREILDHMWITSDILSDIGNKLGREEENLHSIATLSIF